MASPNNYYRSYKYGGNVKVSLIWNSTLQMYELQFNNIGGNWDTVKKILDILKSTIPAGERDYDTINKTWYLHEQHGLTFKILLEHTPQFDFTFVEKSVSSNIPSISNLPSVNNMLAIFKNISTVDISNEVEYPRNEDGFRKAKKIYYRTCMLLHPDKNPDDNNIAARMSKFNANWDNLQIYYFKTKEEVLILS